MCPELQDNSLRFPELQDSSSRCPELQDSSSRCLGLQDNTSRCPELQDSSLRCPEPQDNTSRFPDLNHLYQSIKLSCQLGETSWLLYRSLISTSNCACICTGSGGVSVRSWWSLLWPKKAGGHQWKREGSYRCGIPGNDFLKTNKWGKLLASDSETHMYNTTVLCTLPYITSAYNSGLHHVL
jgi:hypothetical protein